MNTPLSPAGMRIVRHLLGFPPQTIAELTEELGVTRTAVAEPLEELRREGWVVRTAESLGGRGRPTYRYAATEKAFAHLCPGNQHLLVPAIWKALERLGGLALREQVIDEVSSELATQCQDSAKDGMTGLERLRMYGGCESCRELPDGTLRFVKRTCRFFTMFDDTATVCAIHLRTLGKILGQDVQRVQYRHAGAPCCVFEVPPLEKPSEIG